MDKNLCRKYGFNATSRRMRVQIVGLGADWLPLGKRLHKEIIAPSINEIVEDYYTFIFSEPLLSEQINGVDLPTLKVKQANYLLSLGMDFLGKEYFETRLRIGQAHARVKLPLSLYQSAYLHLQNLLIKRVRNAQFEQAETERITEFILRIICLDMSLASDTYLQANVEGLEKTLSALADEKDQLVSNVNHDTLTGTASRAYILDCAENAMNLHPNAGLCIIFADIDHFKEINDRYGHVVGDDVLIAVSQRMMHELREKDAVGRVGGEEFLVLVPGLNMNAAHIIAERLRERLMQSPIHSHTHTISVTMSFGVAEWTGHETLERLIERADEALYKAKKLGRNRVECDETHRLKGTA